MENKKRTKAALLITTSLVAIFLLAIPMTPLASASRIVNVSVTPALSTADFGGTFTANLNISNTDHLAGYDVRIHYNPNVLTATSAILTGTLFDQRTFPAMVDGIPIGLDVARSDIIQSIGVIRWVVVIVGPYQVAPNQGGLLSVNFKVNDPSSSLATSSDYPSTISILKADLAENHGGFVTEPPRTTSDGAYMPTSDVGYQGVGCSPRFVPFFDTTVNGLSAPVFCNIVNTGTQSITVRGDFSYRSLRGLTGTLSSPSITLNGGQVGQVTASLTLAPQTIDIFVFTAQGTRLITFSDGSVLAVSGAVRHFQMIVYTTDFQGEFSGQNG